MDLDKYKDDSHLSQITTASDSVHSSPEKAGAPQQEAPGAGGQMVPLAQQNHDSNLSTTSSSGANGEKIIELQYKWGLGYIQVSTICLSNHYREKISGPRSRCM